MTALPPSIRRYQSVSYGSAVCDAKDDVLAAAGIEPEERRTFISYSRQDAMEAVELAEALSDEGFQTYLDTRSNRPGSLWEEVLRDALVDAALVVVLETANSAASGWVKREIGYATARGAGVIAVQPGPPVNFRYIAARFVGDARDAGPFVAEQHRLLVSGQRESRVRSVIDRITQAGVQAIRDGGSVQTPRQLIGVYPRPVTLRQLRRTVNAARVNSVSPVTYSPEPVLSVKRDDRRWMHDVSHATALGDGSLWEL